MPKANNPGCRCFYGFITSKSGSLAVPPFSPSDDSDDFAFRLCVRGSSSSNLFNMQRTDARTEYSDSGAHWVGIDTDNRRFLAQKTDGSIQAKAVEGISETPLFNAATTIATYDIELIKYHGNSGYSAVTLNDAGTFKYAAFNNLGNLVTGPHSTNGIYWGCDVDESGDLYYGESSGNRINYYKNGVLLGWLPNDGINGNFAQPFCAGNIAYTVIYANNTKSNYRIVEITDEAGGPIALDSVCNLSDLGFFEDTANTFIQENIAGIFYDDTEEVFECCYTPNFLTEPYRVGVFTLDGDTDALILNPFPGTGLAGWNGSHGLIWMVKYDN